MDVSVKQKVGGDPLLKPHCRLSERANAYAVRRGLARYISAHALRASLTWRRFATAIRYLDNGFSLAADSLASAARSTGPKGERSP